MRARTCRAARLRGLVLIPLVLLAGGCQTGRPGAASRPLATAADRIVNLGDSITDGQTYALLVAQALREAGKPTPRFYGAGLGGDTAAGMLKRLDRDVLVHRPTLVMLSAGINDLALGVKLPDYEATVRAIIERLRRERVQVMLLTTTNLGPQNAAAEPGLQAINAALHRLAARYHLPLAEVYRRMQEARQREGSLWEDGAHLNFIGYRWMARAIVDALGYPDVPIPTEFHLAVLPGVIPEWRVLAVKENRPLLDAAAVAALKVDDAWRRYPLPETKPAANWWLDQERRRGVAVNLPAELGPAQGYLAVAELPSPQARAAVVNLGGELGAAWLNGQRLFGPASPPRGWHPGAYRIPVQLRAGANRLVVETGARFFLSVTDTADW